MTKIISNKALTLLSCLAVLSLGACVSKKPEVKDWGSVKNETPYVFGNEENIKPPVIAPPQAENHSGSGFYGSTTKLAGCYGNYTLADSNGRVLSSGRAYNAQEGVYALSKKGIKTGQIINANLGQSLLFNPDCNCGAQLANANIATMNDGAPPQNTCHH